jgi:hypothetical protein
MIVNGILSVRPTWVHRTDGKEFGYWRTPSSSDGEGGIMEMREDAKGRYKLRDHVQPTNQKFWPTPVGYDATPGGPNNHYHGLGHMAKTRMWPTISVHGNYNRRGASATSGDGLVTQVKKWPTPKRPTGGGQTQRMTSGGGIRKLEDAVSKSINQNTGKLNPQWVEWLMGWPIGWTGLKCLEMDGCLRSWLESFKLLIARRIDD